MADPELFLGYRPVPFKTSEFAPANDRKADCIALMGEDLAKSGLTVEDARASPHPWFDEYTNGAYLIPYSDEDGRFITNDTGNSEVYAIKRFLNSKGLAKGEGKYGGPSTEDVGPERSNHPYIPYGYEKTADTLFICEGEKKTLCVHKYLKVDTIGIKGKDNWAVKGKLHPVIERICERYDHVVIIPDGDITRWDISASYGTFKASIGDKAVLLHPEDKIDDMIVRWLEDEVDVWEQFELIEPYTETVFKGSWLAEHYGITLMSKNIPHSNEANAYRLWMGMPDVFPEVWRNLDTQKVYLDDVAMERKNDIDLLMAYQHRFSLFTMTEPKTRTVIGRVADEHARSPWLDYLHGLVWDGERRVHKLFTHYCSADAKWTDFYAMLASHWLAGHVARQYVPGTPQDYMVVAYGAQGIGKSSFPRTLWSQEMCVDMIGVESQHKDEVTKMHTGKCVLFEELASLYKKEDSHLKALISAHHEKIRRPYGRSEEDLLRRFSLYGSTNKIGFLAADFSGYRRWGVVHFGQVQFADLERDREQIWAEAVTEYRTGGRWFENITVPDAVIGEHVKEDPMVDKLLKELEKTGLGELGYQPFFDLEKLAFALDMSYKGGRMKAELNEAVEWLKSHGWRKEDTYKYGGEVFRRVLVKDGS